MTAGIGQEPKCASTPGFTSIRTESNSAPFTLVGLLGAALDAAAPLPPGGGGAKRFLQALSRWA